MFTLKVLLSGIMVFTSTIASGENAATSEAKEIAQKVKRQLEMYHVDCNEFPTTEQGLSALKSPPKDGCKNWGPDSYLREIPMDPWNRPWKYKQIDKNRFELWSLGADDSPVGTADATDVRIQGKL
ncbi:MAG: type II secretion system protein GspG [Bdellovibrionales bacterium]